MTDIATQSSGLFEQVGGVLTDHMGQGIGDLLVQFISASRMACMPPIRVELGSKGLDRSSLLADVGVQTPHPDTQHLNLSQYRGIRARQVVATQQGLQFIHCQQYFFEVCRVH